MFPNKFRSIFVAVTMFPSLPTCSQRNTHAQEQMARQYGATIRRDKMARLYGATRWRDKTALRHVSNAVDDCTPNVA
jgi:hypothetical protein